MRYLVKFGQSQRVFFTRYHTDQFCRALALNGTHYTVIEQHPLHSEVRP